MIQSGSFPQGPDALTGPNARPPWASPASRPGSARSLFLRAELAGERGITGKPSGDKLPVRPFTERDDTAVVFPWCFHGGTHSTSILYIKNLI
jgi:hypothetical protein